MCRLKKSASEFKFNRLFLWTWPFLIEKHKKQLFWKRNGISSLSSGCSKQLFVVIEGIGGRLGFKKMVPKQTIRASIPRILQ